MPHRDLSAALETRAPRLRPARGRRAVRRGATGGARTSTRSARGRARARRAGRRRRPRSRRFPTRRATRRRARRFPRSISPSGSGSLERSRASTTRWHCCAAPSPAGTIARRSRRRRMPAPSCSGCGHRRGCGGRGIRVAGAASAADDSRRIDPRALAAVCVLDDLPTLFEAALAWDADSARALRRRGDRVVPRRGPRCATSRSCSGAAASPPATRRSTRSCGGRRARSIRRTSRCTCGARGRSPILIGCPPRSSSRAGSRRVHRAASGPGALATCAWLAWALGRSTHAELYALEACAIEPEHGLAEIVRSFVHAGHLPDWAFQRPPRSKRAS